MVVKFDSKEEIDSVMYSVDYMMEFCENNFRFATYTADLDDKNTQKDLKKYVDVLETLQLIKDCYDWYNTNEFTFTFQPHEFLKVAMLLYDESKDKHHDKVKQGIERMRKHMSLPVNYVDKNEDDKKPDIEFIEPIRHSNDDNAKITDKMVGFMRDVTRESSDNSEESSD